MMGDRVGCPFAPRCPLAQDACTQTEPDLVTVAAAHATAGEGHRSACHFREDVATRRAGPIFSDSSREPVL
jgi:ABC-type dipeptide/oligopeptide/nickel transport system ATPase component